MVRCRPAQRKPRPSISAVEIRRVRFARREFQELGASRRRAPAAAAARSASGGSPRAARFAASSSPAARSERMPSIAIAGGGGAAELVVEDFERQRAAIAGARRPRRDSRRSGSRPGRDSSGSGGSATAGPSRAPARRRPAQARSSRPAETAIGAIGLPRTQIWKLSSTMPRLGRSAPRDDLPGGGPVLDVAAPGERLVADPHAALAGEIGEFGEVGGRARGVVERVLGETLEHRHSRRAPSSSHQVELALAARSKFLARVGAGIASKSRSGCSATISSPRSAASRRASRGLPRKKVRSFSKDLDRAKARLGRRREFVFQRAAHADRGDRPSEHRQSLWTGLECQESAPLSRLR